MPETKAGIMCHIFPPEGRAAIVISMTCIRMPRPAPLATAIQSYQKHRLKKLKKQAS